MKKVPNSLSLGVGLLLVSSTTAGSTPSISIQDIPKTIIDQTRRVLNFSSLFSSPTSKSSYERISSQPVFTVTTPWGSPYLLFERSDRTESNLEFDDVIVPDDLLEGGSAADTNILLSKQTDTATKQVALYFMDEEDALRLRDEMLQMEQMRDADMRITSSSLGKAVSQCVNLNKGLLTGQPMNEMNGNMKGPDEGGVLRYKIVPPKRELFYAARCKGRERVGLWNANPEDDAKLMLSSVPVIGGTMAMMRKAAVDKRKRERRRGASATADEDADIDPIREEYKHMEGFVGVPVFHCPEMKKHNKIKSLLRNERQTKQTPLYFSYEDLMDAWTAMKQKSDKKNAVSTIPETPDVEVYNMMDVVTSIDKDQWNVKRAAKLRRDALLAKIPVVNKLTGTEGKKGGAYSTPSGLGDVVFIPNSKSTSFKELMSSVGNGKARLRPMRPWGRDM